MSDQTISAADGRSIVERLMEVYGCQSLPELALAMLENLSTVKGWKHRGSVPLEHCARTAIATGCSLDWLVLGQGQMQKRTKPESGFETKPRVQEATGEYGDLVNIKRGGREVSFVLVPRYGAVASAGPGRVAGEAAETALGEIAFEAAWMRAAFGRAGSGFALLDVRGTSMEPTLWDGETILVDLQSTEVVSGGLYVLRDGEDVLVKRLQRMIGGGVEVVSDNPNFRSQAVADPEQLTVIGRVVWPKVR
jgi:phage repressor protein C with HTH and peptisase S24 domain